MDLRPLKYNLPPVTVGDTYPAAQFAYGGTGTLSRVRIKIKDSEGTTALNLDSDTTGITITTTTSGAWAFTMDEISAATSAALTAGLHNYDLETTTAAGNVATLLSGNWELLPQITD